MRALSTGALAAACVWLGACAGAPPAPIASPSPADSSVTWWGDEYEEPVDVETVFHAPTGLDAEWVRGETRSARIDATAQGFTARLRSQARGDTGSLTFRGDGVVREIAAGHVMPTAAEEALLGTSSNGSDLRAPPSVSSNGLRMAPATSTWAESKGAGAVLQWGGLRASVAGCETDGAQRFGFAGLECRTGGNVFGVVAATALRPGAASRMAGSFHASADREALFASAEVALANDRVRSVARMVAGARREWSAVAIAGAGPARDSPLVFSQRARWGAAIERRDAWGWGSNRAGISLLTRRDAETDVQRRRVSWDGAWRACDGVRLELAARLTREIAWRSPGGAIAASPALDVSDDWRARATLRTAQSTAGGAVIENVYRVEWVQNRSGRPGTVATWSARIRSGPMDSRVSVSARALLDDQVAYEPDAAPLAAGRFAALSGRGASVTASARLWLRRNAWLGATWANRPPSEPRTWVSAGIRI